MADLNIVVKTKDESSRALRDIQQNATGLGKAFGDVGKIAGGFLLAGGVEGAFRSLAGMVGGALKDASRLEESMSKVNVVFGDSSKDIQAWASNSAKAFGQSKQAALEAVGTYGNLFQAFGVGREEAGKMSKSLVELATDLASFNDTPVDDALVALRSGLSGETEPLKRFGVAINDARLKTEALRLGLIATEKDALTPGAKAQAAYALIMKDTSLAQGDFARTAGSAANLSRTLAANMTDLSAKMGAELLPVQIAVTRGLIELVPVVASVAGEFGRGVTPVKDFTGALVELAAAAVPGSLKDYGLSLDDLVKTARNTGPMVAFTHGLSSFNDAVGISSSRTVDYQTRLKELGQTELPDVAAKSKTAAEKTKEFATAEDAAKRASGDFGQKIKDLATGMGALTEKANAGFEAINKWKNVPTQEQLNINMAIAQEEAALARLNLSLLDGTAKRQGNTTAVEAQVTKLEASLELHRGQKEALDKVRDAQLATNIAVDAGTGKLGPMIAMESEWARETSNANAALLATDGAVNIGAAAIDRFGAKLADASRKALEAMNSVKSLNEMVANMQSGTGASPADFGAPGHASGLAYVPFDNYSARLHKGEAVLTARDNRAMAGLSSGVGAMAGELNDMGKAVEKLGRAVVPLAQRTFAPGDPMSEEEVAFFGRGGSGGGASRPSSGGGGSVGIGDFGPNRVWRQVNVHVSRMTINGQGNRWDLDRFVGGLR